MANRRYSEKFKRDAVNLVRSGLSVQAAAEQLRIPNGTLWNWAHRAGVEIPFHRRRLTERVMSIYPRASQPPLMPSAGQGDVVDLATYQAALDRISQLERENEMLVHASAFFARRLNEQG